MSAPTSHAQQKRSRILIVDDERFIRDVLAEFLSMEGYSVQTVDDGQNAIEELGRQSYDLVLSDLKMPRLGGMDLLKAISSHHHNTLTVIMTGFGTVETAIEAMKEGAYDYVLKPFKVEEVLHIVRRGLEKQRLASENLRLREALSLYKISEAISASLSLDEVLTTLEQGALQELGADVVKTTLDDGQGGWAVRATTTSARAPEQADFGELSAREVLERLGSGEPLMLHGPSALELYEATPEPRPSSVMVVPLKMRERLIGWTAASSLEPTRRFDEGQRKLLTLLASRAAAAIENARLYEDLQATFQQTIQSLATTIDKMDRYTAGHSERVSVYASKLAAWLGLDDARIEIVRQAALMHDIGKVGCVLNLHKTGKLTPEEYAAFQQHPSNGKDILEPIRFLEPVVPGVHLHHERWDGRGYPLGLTAQGIPLIARIIAVADAYDAMTSNRSYRLAMPHEVTIDEIDRCAGTQFDPDVAAVFTENIEALRDELRAAGRHVPE